MVDVSLSLLGGAGWQFLDDSGRILAGGRLYTYEAGGTTPAETYTDHTGNTSNGLFVQLDSAGRPSAEIWLLSGQNYKFVVKRFVSTGVYSDVRTYDYIPGNVAASDIAAIQAELTAFIASLASTDGGGNLVGFKQAGTGAVARTVQSKLEESVTPADFGALGDSQLAFVEVTMVASQTTLTVNTAIFAASDVGKYIFVPRCGTSGYALVTTITGFTSATQVTLAGAAVKGVTARNLPVLWGTDDGPALQKMFDACFESGQNWYIPPGPSGTWLTAQALNVRQCQNTFTNARNARPPSWTIDNGATIKACALMTHVIRFGAEDVDYSQFLREAVIDGGVIDCSFLADIGVDVPFSKVTTVQNLQVKNIRLKGMRFGSLTAPGASGGNQATFCSSGRDTDYVTVTGITKANPAVVTAPDHNYSNSDVVTLVGVAGMTEANLKFYKIANVTQNTFELVNTDSSAWGVFTGSALVSRCMPSMRVPQFVTGATQAFPPVITFSKPHGFANGQTIYLSDLGGMTEIGTVTGPLFTAGGVTSTTLELTGVDATGFSAYTGNGCAIEYIATDLMQTWLWCENAPDVDTSFNQISGVRLGICAEPANATGYDGKHIKNHMYNYSEAGEMFASYVLGGDQEIIGCQSDGPFRHVCWWKGPRNKTVGMRVNYDPNLPTYDLYATIHRLESGSFVTEIGGGFKAGSDRILSDSSQYLDNYEWIGVSRLNVFSYRSSGWATASDPVLYGTITIDAAAVTFGAADSGGAGFKLLRVPN